MTILPVVQQDTTWYNLELPVMVDHLFFQQYDWPQVTFLTLPPADLILNQIERNRRTYSESLEIKDKAILFVCILIFVFGSPCGQESF